MYFSTKTYSPERGLSCCFRQWSATHSHCSLLHGYALGFTIIFGADKLDARGWVVDFGALDPLHQKLKEYFDHKLAVAADDPALSQLLQLDSSGVADVIVFPDGVGCEKFAKLAFGIAEDVIADNSEWRNRGVWVHESRCFEHTGNSAIYRRREPNA